MTLEEIEAKRQENSEKILEDCKNASNDTKEIFEQGLIELNIDFDNCAQIVSNCNDIVKLLDILNVRSPIKFTILKRKIESYDVYWFLQDTKRIESTLKTLMDIEDKLYKKSTEENIELIDKMLQKQK